MKSVVWRRLWRRRSLPLLLLLLSLLLVQRSSSFVIGSHRESSRVEPRTMTADSLSDNANTNADADADSKQPANQSLLVSLRDRLGCDPASTGMAGLILASQSPRRREILTMMGLAEGDQYLVEPSPLDESKLQVELGANGKQLSPVEYTRRLAEAKASALAEAHADAAEATTKTETKTKTTYYLGSDTIVEIDESILEKPRDAEDAKRMLTSMSGRKHRVHTGVALYKLGGCGVGVASNGEGPRPQLIDSFTDTACVTFTDLTEDDIDAYIRSGEPMDKAGSYGIQGIGGQFVTEISGDFFTVMGLPMHRTSKLIAKALQAE